MKRDIDLARQLLLDIENRGADCSVSVLRTGPNQESEDRVRYHLRLLIDAGLLKEVDRTASGVPCLRLTHDGHELLELARSENRWREAKWACQQRIGGLSLAVIRAMLVRSAVSNGYSGRRRWRSTPYYYSDGRIVEPVREPFYREPYYREPLDRDYYRSRVPIRYEPYRYDDPRVDQADWWLDDESRYVRVRPEYRDRYAGTGPDLNGDGRVDVELESTLPDYLI